MSQAWAAIACLGAFSKWADHKTAYTVLPGAKERSPGCGQGQGGHLHKEGAWLLLLGHQSSSSGDQEDTPGMSRCPGPALPCESD